MILLCIASIDWKKSGLINLIALTYAALAIFATLSVSNLLMFLLVVAFYLIINLKVDGHIFRKFATVGLVPIIIFYVIHPLILNMVSSSELFDNRTSTGRIDQISQMFEGDLGFAENHERVNLVSEYVGHIQQAPLIGRGTGFSESQVSGPHNMYLKHWADNGIPGLLAYLLMIAGSFRHFLVLRDVRGMIFVFIVFCAGFFDHNLLNIMTIVSLLGIFGTLAYLDSSKQVNIADPKSSPVL
ncbi:MAG: hypothetical protein NPINA01_33280 [Nitrospinaceae bacterium]|nr:MAG: hypothetical protein NPINA01_33280 [Nitrospinaceae bacterium]